MVFSKVLSDPFIFETLWSIISSLDELFTLNGCAMDFYSVSPSHTHIYICIYRVARKKKEQSIQLIFSGLCSEQQLSFFTLLDRASFPHYNNTKIIKFGWELFILWVLSYGLSFSGFARFPEFRGTINDKSMANHENDSPSVITHKIKSSQPNLMILVLL